MDLPGSHGASTNASWYPGFLTLKRLPGCLISFCSSHGPLQLALGHYEEDIIEVTDFNGYFICNNYKLSTMKALAGQKWEMKDSTSPYS